MKKILLGTTAVVALGAFSTEAFAADKIQLKLGGFLRDYVTYSNHDENTAGTNMKLGQFQNGEVYVTGSTKLDSGITVASRVEIETNGEDSGNSTDRVYMTLASDQMGLLRLGLAAHMMDDHAVRAPIQSKSDWGDFLGYMVHKTVAAGSAANDLADFGDNAIKIGYQTPEFSGVTGYVSYGVAEGSNASSGRELVRSTTHDSASFGVAYSGEVSGASVSADIGQMIIRSASNGSSSASATAGGPLTDGKKVTRGGLNVGMAGFTVGGSYSSINGDAAATTAIDSLDGKAWEIGVAYETGPYSVAANYMTSKIDGTTTAGNDKWTAYHVGFGYDLGAGVGLTAEWVRNKLTQEGTAANSSSTASALIAGVEIGF